ncbi:NUDIX domain-containing protein [Bacillaceae bacterium S4-13-58]
MVGDSKSIWLQVAGIVISEENKWLVVKKQFGSLINQWSLPTDFVNDDETLDEAAIRQVREETGIESVASGIVGIRTGLLKDGISDHLILFSLKPVGGKLKESDEKSIIQYLSPQELLFETHTSRLIKFLLRDQKEHVSEFNQVNPGHQFEYKRYKIFRP